MVLIFKGSHRSNLYVSTAASATTTFPAGYIDSGLAVQTKTTLTKGSGAFLNPVPGAPFPSSFVPVLPRAEVTPVPNPATSSAVSNPITNSLCPAGNGTRYISEELKAYRVICDVDFVGNDHPFLLVKSFESCVQACDALNRKAGSKGCIAALFVPSRMFGNDDCYLKYSIDHPTMATLAIEGAILVTGTPSSTSSPSVISSTTSALPFSNVSSSSPPSVISSPTFNIPSSSTPGAFSSPPPGVIYASGKAVVKPQIAGSKLHGPSQNVPTTQYVEESIPPQLDIADSLLVTGANGDLTSDYDISLGTGNLHVNISTQSHLAPLKNTPHLSRDGGRGGYLNGKHLFIFCDTGSYTNPTLSSKGDFLGFVSSSVTVDIGMNGVHGEALNLQDGIGAWSDDAGRMRSFAPLTQGEESYNQAMQGNGQRYAIWPEASLIPLDAETAIIYAPIVYDNVNRVSKAAVFTYTGATLLSITASGKGGPVAERKVKKLFKQNEIEWGCSGGIRSWGPSGIGGTDGKVYVFGNIPGGLLLGRTSPADIANHDSVSSMDRSLSIDTDGS